MNRGSVKPYRSGFVTIVGRPNVGKSTLLNAIVGEKVAIVSDRPQTTRNRIQGVWSREGMQMVFVDTPGLHIPKNKLGEYMVKTARSALDEVEAVVLVIDAAAGFGAGDKAVLEQLQGHDAPLIVALNKCDRIGRERIATQREMILQAGDCYRLMEISAKYGEGLPALMQVLAELMPEGPQYYPHDMITDQPEQRLAAEFIREGALGLLREEVPHGLGVEILEFKPNDAGTLLRIMATMYCEQESHKGIVIGRQGAMLKSIGTQARQQMESIFGMQVFLDLHIKVRENWRNSDRFISELGYGREDA